jgi:hypothetical protein
MIRVRRQKLIPEQNPRLRNQTAVLTCEAMISIGLHANPDIGEVKTQAPLLQGNITSNELFR